MAARTISRTARRSALAALGLGQRDVVDTVEALKAGLPFKRLAAMARTTGLSNKELAAALDIPPRTLARRKADGKLTGPESERVFRLARLFDLTAELFEQDDEAARAWLRRPAKALGGRPPLELAETETGARAVEDLIGRLEHGVFS